MDTLINGVMYFADPLLNWTLVGIIKALAQEIHQKRWALTDHTSIVDLTNICRFNAPTHLEVLQTLLLSTSCPRLVLVLCGPRVMALMASRTRNGAANPTALKNEELNRVFTNALGAREEGASKQTFSRSD